MTDAPTPCLACGSPQHDTDEHHRYIDTVDAEAYARAIRDVVRVIDDASASDEGHLLFDERYMPVRDVAAAIRKRVLRLADDEADRRERYKRTEVRADEKRGESGGDEPGGPAGVRAGAASPDTERRR